MSTPHTTHAGCILIVDDDPAIRELLRQGAGTAGYRCRTAGSAEEALETLAREPAEVVVTDIGMPGMDGLELCRALRRDGDASVVVMTGYTAYSYEQIVAQGASDFLEKPIRIAEFVARIKRVFREREALRQRDNALVSVRHSLDRLQGTTVEVVRAMSMAMEMRDPYTAGHQERVAELACAIARELGLAPDGVFGLRMASILHDIGKMAVPAEILTKPGALTELEFELIKTHVQAGFDILKTIQFPWPLAEIVRQHHERVDGSGYPRGLRGEAILIEARILAVADVVETMMSHRPYRPARGDEVALEELTGGAGGHYDAAVAEACLRLFREERFRFS